jgi:GntR family transcriptional repressor for pyruvate dehydrogenase complex
LAKNDFLKGFDFCSKEQPTRMNDELDYFFSIKAQKLYTQIVEQFVEMIKRGEFEPGQKLPSERALSHKLNVSRTSLREALIALQMMGVVEIKPNQGTYITDKTVPPILKEVAYINLGESPFQILQARKAIEPNIAALAASQCDDESLHHIESILTQIKNTIYDHTLDLELYNELDCDFHITIAKATQNPILIGIGYIINNLMSQELWMTLIKNTSNATQSGQQEGFSGHEAVFSAIKSGNPHNAKKAMKDHLDWVEKVAIEADLFKETADPVGSISKKHEAPDAASRNDSQMKVLDEHEVR